MFRLQGLSDQLLVRCIYRCVVIMIMIKRESQDKPLSLIHMNLIHPHIAKMLIIEYRPLVSTYIISW